MQRQTYSKTPMRQRPDKSSFANFFAESTFDNQARKISLESRRANFNLGNTQEHSGSIYRQQYRQNSIGPQADLSNSAKQARKANFTLGNNRSQYNSLYSSNFSSTLQNSQKIQPIKPRGCTDIFFGSYQSNPTTEAKSSFTNIQQQPNSLGNNRERDLRASHFCLGQSPVIYQTQSRNYGRRNQQGEIRTEGEQMKKEMRISHFNVGNSHRDFSTANKAHFNQRSAVEPEKEIRPPKSNIEFGKDINSYSSVYKSFFSYYKK